MNIEILWGAACGLLFLSEKTRKLNQMQTGPTEEDFLVLIHEDTT